ncbi:hypothetical protein RB614_31680 [Phytohabitans sp. ZYX-F-186]|uniref:Uncharacterized protein n=1 Tax=Phytohabitans maris TaxID=3071409 RepID=A0ABU0ZPX4_9ACTN|nr:hypothetical protein [Phytohabitans sp. ZYX-F-186]MDQ7909093.1 hypothetical protein [Phytohabitans sp. ZYX-F-186]
MAGSPPAVVPLGNDSRCPEPTATVNLSYDEHDWRCTATGDGEVRIQITSHPVSRGRGTAGQ